MRRWWHIFIPVLAMLLQPLPILFIMSIPYWVYGETAFLSEAAGWTASVLGLALCAGVSLLLGNLGVYGLLTRSRLAVAVPLIVLFCVPALLGGVVYLHAALIFVTLV